MLILLPPSEGKTERRRGRPLDLGDLSFPELTPTRDRILDSVAAVSAGPDPFAALGVSPNLVEEVARNTRLRTSPVARAGQVYSGVLYDALDLASLDAAARRRASRSVVIVSALFGALRVNDRIPSYRLSMSVNLPGIGPLAHAWRAWLDPVLTSAAGSGLIVDCRSSTYAAAWRPQGRLSERWVQIAVPGASHMAKHTRGLVTRELCASAASPRTPAALADALSSRFAVELVAPGGPGRPWQLRTNVAA